VKYFDMGGKPIVLLELIISDPAWARSRIKAGEKAEAEVKRLKVEAAKWEKWARQMRFAFAGVAPWEREGGE